MTLARHTERMRIFEPQKHEVTKINLVPWCLGG